ncbi:hypothetical protein Btru_054341 [Bulinus truncatus]|nr:hypothetical protein Btru_054341 [Bulinus truncatus]
MDFQKPSSLKLSASLLIFNCIFVIKAGVLRTNENHCNHTLGRLHDDVFYNVRLDSEHIIKKRSADKPLRIHLHYDNSVNDLPFENQKIVKIYVQKAVEFWQSALKVRPSNVPLRLRRTCLGNVKHSNRTTYCLRGCKEVTTCGAVRVPEEHLDGCLYYDGIAQTYVVNSPSNPGIEADFILYVASLPSSRCNQGETIAFAAHCQQEAALDRPVAGYCSICPSTISTSVHHTKQLLSTIKHEIVHALGFTAALYAYYRNSDGEPLTERDAITGFPLKFNPQLSVYQFSNKTVKEVVRPDWSQISGLTDRRILMMVTPRVVEEVRNHFNCSDLEGAELEDQGIDGTFLTHWEKRVFENEAMTGTYTHSSVFSRITFAMMEDTGWYNVDYSKAGFYEWGRNLGCDFVKNSCYHWISTRQARHESIHPFCDLVKSGELWTDCSQNKKSVVICNLVEYSRPLPAKYQYFHALPGITGESVSKFGGSVALADYCPFLQELSWLNEFNVSDRGSYCEDADNNISYDVKESTHLAKYFSHQYVLGDDERNYFGEVYGNNSMCFEHASKWYLHQCSAIRSPQHSGSGCYQNHGVTCPPDVKPPVSPRVVVDRDALCGSSYAQMTYHPVFLLWTVFVILES